MEIQKKMESNLLKQGERLDDLQLGGLGLIQDPDKFCFGVDAVLLSDFAKVCQGETVLDMGTGNGIIPVLLAGKTEGKHFTGLEIQADTAEMAKQICMIQRTSEGKAVRQYLIDLEKANDNYKVHPSLYLEAMNEYDKNYGYAQIEKIG